MKHFLPILLTALFFTVFSCQEKDIPKPDKLIGKKQMIEMLVDVHLAKAISQRQYDVPDSLRLSSTDLYYSVLAKYDIPDSVFVRSLIYYSSRPKDYEKMYNDVINILKEMEEETLGQQELNVGNEPKQEEEPYRFGVE
ncbi:MAG: DUF4296 domain-containing protein [Prolixibacteraceae bacterium]|jgi:hypothetical protein|nr:DUF4296 domain-containing protein [Prolixibacteraceae bacterium]